MTQCSKALKWNIFAEQAAPPTMTKSASLFVLFLMCMASTSAFVVSSAAIIAQHRTNCVVDSTALHMGLFDFFNDDARKEREERKQREVEEQERYQQEILARRSNPKLMEEYEAKVRVRRALRMAGDDEAAEKLEMYSGLDDEKVA